MKEKLELSGICTIVVRDRNNKILSFERKKNLITNVGKAHVAKLIGALLRPSTPRIKIGTGTTPPSPEDIDLEMPYMEKTASVSFSSPSSVVFGTVFHFTEEATITESGLFLTIYTETGPSPKVMLSRQVFTGKLIEADRYLEIVWTIGVT